MPTHVSITRAAAKYRDAMRGKARGTYDAWLEQLKRQGCAAMEYRLHGDLVDRLCVRHLYGTDRAVVVFDAPTSATIVLLGPHERSDPQRDVYTMLYQVAGVGIPTGKRTKPSCCDKDGFPPEGSGLAEELADRMAALAKGARRRG